MRLLLRVLGWLFLLAVLAGSGVLTVARLLQPPGERWIQAVSFTPWAMPGYAVLVAVALVLLLRGRRWGRLPPALLALVAAAGLGVHGSWFAPQVSGPNPPPADDADRLVVMTSNVLGGRGDPIALVEEAVEADADVLVVQEITETALSQMEDAGVDEAFGHRAGEPVQGVFGTMVFSRHELGRTTDLPTPMSSFAVPVRVGDTRLELVAVHPSPPVDAGEWVRTHARLNGWVRTHRPDLVVGDFNATADHRPMRVLAEHGYRSVTDLANEGWRPTWPANGKHRVLGLVPIPPVVQIDHVLCGPRMAALRSRTVRIDGTDHLALVATVAPK